MNFQVITCFRCRVGNTNWKVKFSASKYMCLLRSSLIKCLISFLRIP